MKSIASLLISTLLLAGCATVPSGSVCPILSPAPLSAVEALAVAGRQDPSAAAWVINLDRFYSKQDQEN